MTDQRDIDERAADLLARTIDPDAFKNERAWGDIAIRRAAARNLARKVLARMWDAGWLIEDPRRK